MSYLTNYSLQVKNAKSVEDRQKVVNYMYEKDLIQYAFDLPTVRSGILCFDSFEPCRWYDHEDDMYDIATTFPDFTFCLHANGEDMNGCWDHYYHGKEFEACAAHIPKPEKVEW